MEDRALTTQRGCAYSIGSLVIWLAMMPGGSWLLTDWGILPRKLDFLLSMTVVSVVAVLIVWSLGWAHHRYVMFKQPAWITHPATRTGLAFCSFTMVAAWPFGASPNMLVQVAGIAVAPAIGAVLAIVWFLAFGLRQVLAESRDLQP